MTRIGINGFGRIGRLVVRGLARHRDLEVVHVNEPAADTATCAHLLDFDSVHGRFGAPIGHDSDAITVDGQRITHSGHRTPTDIAWDDHGVEIVLETSGAFRTPDTVSGHLGGSVHSVVVSAPVTGDGIPNIVMGCNHDVYDPTVHDIVTAASCTTNCLAPIIGVLHDTIGIERGTITTIHDVTNTQVIVDAAHRDLRRARSAINSLIPTSTGSATAITMIYPELAGKLDGIAVRVPLLNASLVDVVVETAVETAVDDVNTAFREAAAGPLFGILGYEDRPLVSADYTNDTRSAIVDGPSTMVVDKRLLKVLAWYDNEYGYAFRLADVAAMVASRR